MAHRKSNARQPIMRPPPSRAQSATPTFDGRKSPANSVTTTTSVPTKSPARSVNGGLKRKERDFDQDTDQETNINVVVRCRGRNDREVRENSGVVVSTSGVKGSKVDLSMGPSALSNKTYNFDKVFSPAADQEMLFNEVVSPILDEVLGGFNCTIFAYGQTGTGKTYTMSGDITDVQPLPEAAGIIPRVLYSLFDRLKDDEGETSVKCSFIELYNEELRDLLSQEENSKLKIYDDNSKKGQTTTLVQGMEESHIKSASKGLELLKSGSYKRQVAATKCNDLSSRSHTVFTITVYMKKTSDTGEDFVSAGKLNLVDLAGSENIQRSGAENKRAAEAGLINKSLLTLGRVINALVEKSTHIPYRESKLTRLLQDSLGGRTKTCIIATLSPAKSNLEETISTLDYAFRAKNIKNKPQANAMVSKKTMLKEFTAEIEKLKGELMATRQRNGVYLTQEAFEEITTESESRRILSEEQRDKIELMESSLRNKVQELFTLTNSFSSLKKDNEATRMNLDGTKSLLEKTEIVLSHTKKNLAEESFVRKAHQETEIQLLGLGGDLLSTLDTTTGDIRGLHAKLRRRSALHCSNKDAWGSRRTNMIQSVDSLDVRMEQLRNQQESLLQNLSSRMQGFVTDELQELQQSQDFLADKVDSFQKSQAEVNVQTTKAKDDMDSVLTEIRTLRGDVKEKVGAGMQDLSAAAQRISAGISSELEAFHTQLHGSYSSLGREFKSIFEDVTRQMNEHKAEVERLQLELVNANNALLESQAASRQTLVRAMATERTTAAEERNELLQQIGSLIQNSAVKQEERVQSHIEALNTAACTSETTHSAAQANYTSSMASWSGSSASLISQLLSSREAIKSKIKSDWSLANSTSDAIKSTTQAVHSQTLDIVNAQMTAMDSQLSSLDEIISRVKAQNETHHAAHADSLSHLAHNVTESYASIGAHMSSSYTRTQSLNTDLSSRADDLGATFPLLTTEGPLRAALAAIKSEIAAHDLTEYTPTGTTPSKQVYTYPTALPRTAARDDLIERMHHHHQHHHRGTKSPRLDLDVDLDPRSSPKKSPSKDRERGMDVFVDGARVATAVTETASAPAHMGGAQHRVLSRSSSLRDLDPNRSVAAAQAALSTPATPIGETMEGVVVAVATGIDDRDGGAGAANTTTASATATPTPTPTATATTTTTTATATAPGPKEERNGPGSKLPTFSRSVTASSLPDSRKRGTKDKEKEGRKRMTVAAVGGQENLVPGLVGKELGREMSVGLVEGRERRSGRLRGRGSD
ncbi:hypothetical protein CAC42_498 [Sphaceloma murrayae]|uniref:Kinesin motor domain-containing protein n=1 Tax=Sphaceloma murrayae TaxID=2082308 RepID=A0A2K1R3N7_9PEZI|nr:hypothetical protein CAC42_498 [Sphaceloma murrayae]